MKTKNQQKIILYGHPNSGMVRPVRETLHAARVPYQYINIYQSEEGMKQVAKINSGNLSVPTLVFPDRSTLTEPSIPELRSKLEEYGYEITRRRANLAFIGGMLRSPSTWIAFAILVYALLRFLEVL
ncbi:MAG: hypothetical protein PVI99_05805 [Anaerolineales bacterium]|jgi:mycoredoxin